MKYAIALDIGGTSIKYTLVNQNGDILYESSETTQSKENPRPLSDTIKSIVRKMTDYARSRDWGIYGIGIGVPSVVDNGVVLFANNLPELDNQQLDLALAEFNLPVFIDNDANLMGLGEVIYGAAKGLSDIVFLTVGTGIGGALFLNGRLYGGSRNRNQCTCGASGCLEAHASVSALIALYRQLLEKNGREIPSRIDGKYIVERYKAQEKEAVLAMEDHFRNLSLGVASLINIFAPQKVIIGGGISESGDFYIDNIREQVGKYVMKETSYFTTIELARLGNKAGCLGAAALVFNH